MILKKRRKYFTLLGALEVTQGKLSDLEAEHDWEQYGCSFGLDVTVLGKLCLSSSPQANMLVTMHGPQASKS